MRVLRQAVPPLQGAAEAQAAARGPHRLPAVPGAALLGPGSPTTCEAQTREDIGGGVSVCAGEAPLQGL